ncbi:MAG: polyprenyl synthetase family protein [Clostridia bacterium]|nr:polyprenyl synthetase family protein [Clostridia bacterium]
MNDTDFFAILTNYINTFNSFVSDYLNNQSVDCQNSKAARFMLEAMGYSLNNGGKRIRPVLTLEFCRLCCGDYVRALPFALSVEMIHTYSLIHDDLPCMDDDEVRRGKPSSHIVYGYANALLAGDALLTLAFNNLAGCNAGEKEKIKAISYLSKCAGYTGMVGGQVMDIENEKVKPSADDIEQTDLLKTGEMLKASCVLGCICAGGDENRIKAAESFASDIGLAFQIVDDILDVTGDSSSLGKPTGSDEKNNKTTYVSLYGIDNCREKVKFLSERALTAVSDFEDADFLRIFTQKLVNRNS